MNHGPAAAAHHGACRPVIYCATPNGEICCATPNGEITMYVRSKVVKGETYFQIVEGVRHGQRVRQRLVLALGREPDPLAVLQQWKRGLSWLKSQRTRIMGIVNLDVDRDLRIECP